MGKEYENSGTLGRNERKEQPNHPDHTGSVDTTCPQCGHRTAWWLSAWIKRGPTGKFFSLSLKPKERK